ncbi:MAG: hypothetical protein ABI967_02900 [bacterium]
MSNNPNEGNGNHPEVKVATPEVKRLRASGPILVLAVLFVVGAFLSWYFSWFGRNLSDADVTSYLADHNHPRHVQHALLQVQQRIVTRDAAARQWYPQLQRLAGDPETEFRLTVAWVMGFDNTSEEFHRSLLQLLKDREPIVRRNAALSLVRFQDSSGRAELKATLQPYAFVAPSAGEIESVLKEKSQVARGTMLARIRQSGGATEEVRSPLPGSLQRIAAASGTNVAQGEILLTINPDEQSVWEALRGLALIGESEDLDAVDAYVNGQAQGPGLTDRTKAQAALTAKAIQGRKTESRQTIKQ